MPYPTFAKGGFSNIWGAAVLPTDACDMADWPFLAPRWSPISAKWRSFFRFAVAMAI